MSYLHELEEKERKLVNSFIMRHSKFLLHLWIVWSIGFVVSIYISRYTNINENSSLFIFVFSFVLFWIWLGFISIIEIRNDSLSKIRDNVFEIKQILEKISNEEYKETNGSLFARSNKLLYNAVFNNVSKIHVKRDDEYIFIKYVIFGVEQEVKPISIKYAQEYNLFNFTN